MLIADKEPHSPEIEACQDGFNSRFFRSDDPRDLAAVIGTLFSDKQLWINRRQQIIDSAKANYSIDSMVETFLEVASSFVPSLSRSLSESNRLGILVREGLR